MKALKVPKADNPCLNAPLSKLPYASPWYGMRQSFVPSTYQLKKYCDYHSIKPPMTRNDNDEWVACFDENALRTLRKKHPADPVFRQLGEYRELERTLGTYIDGMAPAADGRVHGTFVDTPSTLRWAMQAPSLQTLPRPPEKDDEGAYISPLLRVRDLFIAGQGMALAARDYASLEAVLVGYEARDRELLRLSAGSIQDLHGYIASHAIGRPIDLSWSDSDIKAALGEMKKENRIWEVAGGVKHSFKKIRTGCKRSAYLSFYLGGVGEMCLKEPELFPTEKIGQWYQDLFFSTFPKVGTWHWAIAEECANRGFVTTGDGFRQYYLDPYDWKFKKKLGKWEKRFTQEVKSAAAAKPQHLGAMFVASSLEHLWLNAPEHIKQGLRLIVHDEILGEWPTALVPEADKWLMDSMERPCGWLPLPPEWNMGSHLAIKTSAKRGSEGGSWGGMLEV